MNLLNCINAAKYFLVRQEVLTPLKCINFTIRQGEKIIIIGRSGSGKSVLLSLLSGLDRPCFGDIEYLGQSYSGMTASDLARLRRSGLGIIFQNHNLIPSWTVLENVEAALMVLPCSGKTMRAKALLDQLGISHRMNHLPHQLSMGEKQRAAIARTLVREPKLILADEPTGDVDPDTAAEIIQLFDQIVDHHRIALLVATHGNYPLLAADTVFELTDGKLNQIKSIKGPVVSGNQIQEARIKIKD